MKNSKFVIATLLVAFAGCSCGQGWRPNILNNLHNRIHGGASIGDPCDANGCTIPAGEEHCSTCGEGVSSSYGGVQGEVVYEGTPVNTSVPPSTYVTPGTRIESVPAQRQ